MRLSSQRTGVFIVKEKNTDRFESALKGKTLPIVTLDNKWYQLFDSSRRTFTLTSLEKKLNKLLQRQGQLYNDLKDMKLAKRTLMDKVLENMDGTEEDYEFSLQEKKLDASQRLIKDLIDKINAGEKELDEIPALIESTNKKLLIEGMRICYLAMKENQKDIDAINAWIDSIRVETKKKVIMRQEIQDENNNMYSYIHDILGVEVVDVFDMYYEADIK